MTGLLDLLLVRLGAALSLLLPHRNASGLFFFFPCYHVGGAERVHADILKLVGARRPWIVITNRSENRALRETFSSRGRLLDLSVFACRRGLEAVLAGYLASCVNRCQAPVVFGANSSFYYRLLPHLGPDVCCVDLIHAFGGGIETLSLPHVERLDRRVVISAKTREDLADQYRRHAVPAALLSRIDLVENKVTVPDPLVRTPQDADTLRVLYVGRAGKEKRPHLVGLIARLCRERGTPAEFTLVGDLAALYPEARRDGLRLLGELHDPEVIASVYRRSDILLVTSSREGFPLVIMEAMAHGVVPLATAVGGIPCHLKNGENGFLVHDQGDEARVVQRFAALIGELQGDRALLKRIGSAAYRYAAAGFRGEEFDRYYRELFEGCRG